MLSRLLALDLAKRPAVLRTPGALIEGLALRRKLTVRLASGLSLRDVFVTLGLLLILVMSAVGVVYSSHLCRQLFAEHAVLLEQQDTLQLEWAQLLLEESAWSSPTRIDKVAREQLGMAVPEPEAIELVR